MKKLGVSALVMDYAVYPRHQVDEQHVASLCEALRAGATLPPLVVCAKTRRIVDGFHRARAFARVYGEDCTVSVLERQYKSDDELFLDAVRLNAEHGKQLSAWDRTRILVRGQELKIEQSVLASALHMTTEKLDRITTNRLAGTEPIKATIRHMAGEQLTKRQKEANARLGGMSQTFYVNQIIILLEAGLLDVNNETLMKRIERLRELLESQTMARA